MVSPTDPTELLVVLRQISVVLRQICLVLKQISVVLRQVSIASRHYEGIQVAWRWCGNQNDDGVGAAVCGVEANIGGVETFVWC